MVKKMKKILFYPLGFLVGIINSTLGAGGGMVVVPLLKSKKLEQSEAQATSIAVILPLCILSAVLYLYKGHMTLADSWFYLPFGLIGSLLGAWILPKIPQKFMRKVFAAFMIWAAVRLLRK